MYLVPFLILIGLSWRKLRCRNLGTVTSLLDYKYARMTEDELMTHAEEHARLVEKGNLTRLDKQRCQKVFEALRDRTSNPELKQMMETMLVVLKLL